MQVNMTTNEMVNATSTYLEVQSVEDLMAYGKMMPHLPGRPAAAVALTMVPLARFLRQLHSDWWCWWAPVLYVASIKFRLLMPLQHSTVGLSTPPYDMHWTKADVTLSQVMAAFAVLLGVVRRMVMVTAVMINLAMSLN